MLPLTLLDLYRFVWISGRYGGGKTLLSVAFADALLRSGRVSRIFSNFPFKLSSPLPSSPDDIRDSCVIFDEAWLYFDSRSRNWSFVSAVLAYLRKRNVYLLLPSVFPLDKRLRQVCAQRVAAFSRLLPGLPWLYSFSVGWGVYSDRHFFLLFPSRYFSLYDHLAIPSYEDGERLIYLLGQGISSLPEKGELVEVDGD